MRDLREEAPFKSRAVSAKVQIGVSQQRTLDVFSPEAPGVERNHLEPVLAETTSPALRAITLEVCSV